MRPHLLELQAFGAFPGQVAVDLDALGESGLVLLSGDTGGGKTTLLDALGFALYGVVPGERAKAKDDLRSHHAAVADATWVRLTFTARGQRLRVRRTPEWQRPKTRGTGTVKEQATAVLERWDGGGWEPVAQRLDDVGLEVGRLLGMDAGQFFQVVLLPQGRFAAFLQADHREREKLLKQLFHVHRFEQVERWLADRAASAATAVERARVELAKVGSRVGQAAAVDPPAEPPLDWAGDLAAQAAAERDTAAADTAELLVQRRAAETACAAAEQLAERQGRRRAAEAQQQALLAEEPTMEAVAEELSAAERARPVLVAARAVAARRAEQQQAGTEDAAARAAVTALGSPADGSADVLRARASEWGIEIGRLQALEEVAERAGEAARLAQEATAAADGLAEQVAGLADRLAVLPAERSAAEQAVARAQEAALCVPAAAQELSALRARTDLVSRLRAAQEQEPAALAALATADAEADRLREQADELRVQRFDAMLAELADALEDGTPCPVCGSLDHPDVTEVSGAEVSREAERVAVAAASSAAQRARDAGRAASALQERITLLAEQLGPVETDLAAAVDAAAARLAALEREAGRSSGARTALELLQAEGERLGAELARAEVQEREQRKRAAEAAGTATDLQARLVAALGEGVDLARRLAQVSALSNAHDRAARAADAVTAATAAAEDAERVASEQARVAGFPHVAAAHEAARDPERMTQARQQLDRHRAELAGVRGQLASDELAVTVEPPAAVDAAVQAARAAAAAATDAHEQSRAALDRVADRAQALAALVPTWTTAWQALAPLEEQASALRSLAELAAGRGANRLSMPLSTFVLAARLEEVADAASLRLARMSGQRYTLVHTDSRRDGRSRGGLGLQVRDGWTGRTRDTATLSGGETFMTALALALGLADVVTAEAGGQTIDALFVDEGFGTLDADSLDAVMDVLDDLRSGGRLVGVVSHVADLRLRIPAQVHVLKGSRGSTVRTTSD